MPWDILVKAGDHVVIIQNLNYPEDSEVLTDFNQVDVIHSVNYLRGESAHPQWKVRKSTWDNIQSTVSDYQLRRLTIEE